MDNDLATQNDQEVVENEAPAQSQMEMMAEKLAEIRGRDTEETTEPVVAKPDRVREKDGKFAKTDAPAEPAAQNTEAQETTPPVNQPSTLQAPNGLTAEGKAEFAKASPALQREIVRRENDFHKYYKEVEPLKQAAQYGRSMYAALQPYENTIKSWGTTPDKAVQALFNADHKLTHGSPSDKLQAFAALAKGYGIDLSQGLPEQQYVDPNFAWMQQQNQAAIQAAQVANQRVQQIEARYEQERKDADTAQLNSVLEQAKQNKPHFDELRQEIGLILQSQINRGNTITDTQAAIDQAYEAAMWQSPKHRAELLAKQQADAANSVAQKRAEDASKAKAARLASSVNVAKRGSLQTQGAVGDTKDFMREQLAAIRSR